MSCLIVILILCTSVLCIGATEEAKPFTVGVEVSTSTPALEEPLVLQAGDSFTVSISIDGNPKFEIFELWLKYDPEFLTLVKTADGNIDFTAGDVVAADELSVREDEGNTIKILNKSMTQTIEKSGTIITFNFKVNDNAHGTSVVELAKAAFYTAPDIANNKPMAKLAPDAVNNGDVVVHKFVGEPTVEAATCIAHSKTTYTCATCQEAYVIEGTEFAAHDFDEWTTVTAPNCTDKGQDERICKVCKTEKETKETDALGHDYSTEWTTDAEPDCTNPGSKSHHCTRCDSKMDDTAIDALGHDFSDWTVEKAATCTENGSEKRTCKREGCTEAETQTLEALGHTKVAYEEVEATKEAPGYTGGEYCSVCNEVLTARQEIPQIKDNPLIYVLVAVVAVVAIAGGVCAYVFVVKKKKANG
jgi:hypothetical protein